MRRNALGLEVRRQQVPGATRLHVAGSIDAGNVESLRQALLAAIDDVGGTLILDLAEVDFIDSEGLGAIVGGFKHAIDWGVRLRFVVVHPLVRKLFEITGLTRVLDVYPSLADALAGRPAPGEGRAPTS
jgi:anti-sigma B factor antagonist